MASGHKLYDNSPTLSRGEDGKVGVKREEKKDSKPDKESHKGDEKFEKAASSGLDINTSHGHARQAMHHRHLKEHMDMHHHHEIEHSHHKGDKKALHEKHEREYSEMHGRHHAEMKKLHDSHEKEGTQGETLGTPVKDIEREAKA